MTVALTVSFSARALETGIFFASFVKVHTLSGSGTIERENQNKARQAGRCDVGPVRRQISTYMPDLRR